MRLTPAVMIRGKQLIVGGLLAAGGFAVAAKYGGKPNNPKLPGVPWVVHDGTRPQPRKVETTGAVSVKAPTDAKVLFDGSNLDAWTGSEWRIEDGIMIASPKNIRTKEQFRDFQMHIEWRIPKVRHVNGQQGGNSGVFLMGLYEVQILASHENKTYPDGQAGGMYGQFPPLVNASAPKGDWNSYDIVFKAPRYEGEKVVEPAKLTLLHNGVLLHNAKEYYGPTSHKKLAKYPAKHPEKGPIGLQWHGDPIEFRNIWIREVGEYDENAPK